MANLVYINQPVTRYMVDDVIYDLICKLAEEVSEKRKQDPSFDELASLVNQIADNITRAKEDADDTEN